MTTTGHQHDDAVRALRMLALQAGHRNMRALARAAEIDRTVLLTAARGQTCPRPATIKRAARALGVAPTVLELLFQRAREEVSP